MRLTKQEMEIRNKRILDSAFKLFSEKRIEGVTMQEIADEAGVGVASVFRYYPSKTKLVIAVAYDRWTSVLQCLDRERPMEKVVQIPAIDRCEFLMDFFIELFKNQKELLVYNQNFSQYIRHRVFDAEEMANYRKVMNVPDHRFHQMYEDAKIDGTVRTDLPEKQLNDLLMQTMMAACTHYAGGVIWGMADEEMQLQQLYLLKEMLLGFVGTSSRI